MTDKKDVLKDFKKSPLDGKEIQDKLGRKILLRKPNMSERWELAKALGDAAEKGACGFYSEIVLHVALLDGQVFPTPRTELEIKAALNKLDDAGCDAVAWALVEDRKTVQEEKEAVKK